MNVGIIIAIAEYKDSNNNLPACAKDAEFIYELLKATKKYEDTILYIAKDTQSAIVKEQVVQFLNKFKGKEIEEIFFYYTGHGEFTGNDFHYLFSDYEQNRRNQTSLSNTELDNWLRLLNPYLAVKVIDACQAGAQYIKDSQAFKKFVAETLGSFNHCYFMYSSLRNQSSYQDEFLSYFTRSFGKAVLSFQGNQIRYKDIIDFISDDFHTVSEQTPFFVTQATNTEVFCSANESIKAIISQYCVLGSSLAKYTSEFDGLAPRQKTSALLELIQEDAQRYCSEEEVMERIHMMREGCEGHQYLKDFTDLYLIKTEFTTELSSDVPQVSELGRWVVENKNEYFAKPITKPEVYTEEIQIPKRKAGKWFDILSTTLSPDYEWKTVTKHRDVIVNMELTQETPFKLIRIMAEPKYQNLHSYSCHVTFIFSKTEIRFFYLYNSYRELNWQERAIEPSGGWRTSKGRLQDLDDILQVLANILKGFSEFVLQAVRNKFLPPEITNIDISEILTSDGGVASEQSALLQQEKIGEDSDSK